MVFIKVLENALKEIIAVVHLLERRNFIEQITRHVQEVS
jgi:hypothetical protein